MTKKNPHWGTALDTFLSEEGICEAGEDRGGDARRRLATRPANAASAPDEGAARRTPAHQPCPNGSHPEGEGHITIETLQRAAALVGRELRLELV